MNYTVIPYAFSSQLEGAHLPQRNFVEFSIYFWEWYNSRRKREWQGPKMNFLYSPESIRTRQGKWTSKFWLHRSSKTTLWNKLESRSRCCKLHKIVKSAGSGIAILADKIICYHHLHNRVRRLHWSSDVPEERSSTFRTNRNTEATTQGHVEELLANTAAAETAAA